LPDLVKAAINGRKKSVSYYPSGGTKLGEKLKDQATENITAVHEFVKRLGQAKDFEEALRIQTEFMQSQLNAFGKQATSLGEAYTKAAANRSPSHIEPVSGMPKRKLENAEQRLAPRSHPSRPESPEIADQRLRRAGAPA
jgi:Phasin protein